MRTIINIRNLMVVTAGIVVLTVSMTTRAQKNRSGGLTYEQHLAIAAQKREAAKEQEKLYEQHELYGQHRMLANIFKVQALQHEKAARALKPPVTVSKDADTSDVSTSQTATYAKKVQSRLFNFRHVSTSDPGNK